MSKTTFESKIIAKTFKIAQSGHTETVGRPLSNCCRIILPNPVRYKIILSWFEMLWLAIQYFPANQNAPNEGSKIYL